LYLAFRVEKLGRVLVVGPEANGKSVTVKDVNTVLIRLPGEDPNTSAWVVTSVKGQAVEALGRVEYEADTSNPFGVALRGTFKTLLQVREKGRAMVVLEQRSRAQEGKAVAQPFRITLNVR
jgi:predicted secreted protein